MNAWRESTAAHLTFASVETVARAFADAGHELYLVGGVVRDLLLGAEINDLDFTTSARPEETRALVSPLATALWTQGERFGTIGATIDGRPLEITTFRAESYDEASRKPVVSFGDDLETDLSRRDFTINAMAIDASSHELADPYGGAADLEARILRTPLDPEISFTDDPLRMMRAARFVPRFGLTVDTALSSAVRELAHRLAIVSAERIHDEFERLLGVEDPRLGFDLLTSTGLMAHVVPELDRERWPQATEWGSASADRLVRRAAMCTSMPDAGQPWLRRLRYSTADRKHTVRVATAASALADDSAAIDAPTLRRLAHSIGADAIDDVIQTASVIGAPSERIAEARSLHATLAASEDLADFSPPIDGAEVIELLGIEPGPVVGASMQRLLDHRLDHGPFDAAEARRILTERDATGRDAAGRD